MATTPGFSTDELRATGRPSIYEGQQLREIAFPLGGIGTGCVSLSGLGELVDWEIFNRPNKGTRLPYTFVSLWVQPEGRAVARVVQAPPMPPYSGEGGGAYRGFGFGVTRESGAGLPHLRGATFCGEFPFAEIVFDDPTLPVEVRLEAYSPFIPLNPDDSGIPIAVLRYHVRNRTDRPVALTLAANVFNPLGYPGTGPFYGAHLGGNLNAFVQEGALLRGIACTSTSLSPEDPAYGSLALTTTWPEVTHQACWLRSGWFDMMHEFWDHFAATGTLEPRELGPSQPGQATSAPSACAPRSRRGRRWCCPWPSPGISPLLSSIGSRTARRRVTGRSRPAGRTITPPSGRMRWTWPATTIPTRSASTPIRDAFTMPSLPRRCRPTCSMRCRARHRSSTTPR